jgi:prepilin-type N-terminal cleavage/methylation domain-containing protein
MSGNNMSKHDAGFTLIEALVATAVFTLVVSALYQGLTVGWRGLARTKAEDAAVSLLSQKLASSGIETPLQTATASGTTLEGMSWQTEIAPYAGAATATDTNSPAYLAYWVTVTVHWRDGVLTSEKSLQATTLKIKKAS